MTCSPFFKCQSTWYTEKSGMVQPGDPVNSQDRWGMSTKNTILQHNTPEHLWAIAITLWAFSCVFWMLTFSKPLEPLLGPVKFTAKRCNFLWCHRMGHHLGRASQSLAMAGWPWLSHNIRVPLRLKPAIWVVGPGINLGYPWFNFKWQGLQHMHTTICGFGPYSLNWTPEKPEPKPHLRLTTFRYNEIWSPWVIPGVDSQ